MKKKKEENKENKAVNGNSKKDDLNSSVATTASESSPSKVILLLLSLLLFYVLIHFQKKKRKNKKKNKQQESEPKENSESPKKPAANGTPTPEKQSDKEVSQNEESTPSGKKKRKRRKKKGKSSEGTAATVNGSTENHEKSDDDEEEDEEEDENGEETSAATNNRKRKASQRAKEQLALVPLEERKDDSDPDDTNYIVESPDEDGNPKRPRMDNGSEDSADDDGDGGDFSASAIRHQLETLISGGIFYDSSGEETPSSEEEMDTEIEVSDDSDGSEEDIGEDEDEDEDGSEDFEFNEDVLFESDGSDQFDIEDLGFGLEEGFSNQEPNSDDEIDQVISSIRPKEPEEEKDDDNESKSSKSDEESDPENEVRGPVDDLEELASDDEEDLYAEDDDDAEDLDGFIVDENDIEMLSTTDDEDDDDDISGEDGDDEDEDLGEDEEEDEALDEEENMVPSDVSDQFRAHGRIGCNIEGYDTKVDNGGLLSLDRTSAPKSRSGAFRPFKFTEKKLTETHSVEVAEDALTWMVAPLEARYFYKYIFQRVVLHISRRDKNYFKGLFSSDGLLHMVENNELNYGENINVASYTANGGRLTHNPEGRVFCRQLKSFVNAGYSIQCINPQSFSDEIWYLCEILQELTNSFVGANTYLTPANSAGFAPHYDAIDAFILQVEGKKYWRVWAPEGENALPDESSGNFTEKDMLSKKLVFEGTLEEGDMLYIPRGFYHSAKTGNKHSLHVTVSLCDNVTFSHLLKSVAEDVWESIRRTRLLARRSLPPHYIEMNGIAPLDYCHDYKTE